MRKIKERDILTLGSDNIEFLTLKCFEYNNESYLYLVKLSDVGNENPAIAFVKEIQENDDTYLELVEDEELQSKFIEKINA